MFQKHKTWFYNFLYKPPYLKLFNLWKGALEEWSKLQQLVRVGGIVEDVEPVAANLTAVQHDVSVHSYPAPLSKHNLSSNQQSLNINMMAI